LVKKFRLSWLKGKSGGSFSRLTVALPIVFLILSSVMAAAAPASAETTYSVEIKSVLYGLSTDIETVVPISKDGVPTGHFTPYTFTGLTGVHNFSIPFDDSGGYPFMTWWNSIALPSPDRYYATITLSAENASSTPYYVYYDANWSRSSPFLTWPEVRYFVTPNDHAVIAAAGTMSWNEIIDWVANELTYNLTVQRYLFPNETLAYRYGVCREYSGLCVSMLEARGYTAYVVAGNTTGHPTINHAWVALELNGTLYHFEPQMTWAHQPNPELWANNRTAWYFYNDRVFLPASPTQDPPPPDTYEVRIAGSTNGKTNDIQVEISMDGAKTGFTTPHTFSLKGVHNFTVPYTDTLGRLFYAWSTNAQTNRWFMTINASQNGEYWALYNQNLDLSHPSPAQRKYFITPSDSAVAAAASGKNWSEIVAYVSSLPYLSTHGVNDPVRFPNLTLNGGCFFPDYALLCCSMLRANGYAAYYASMTDNPWIAWVVIDLDGTLTPINPYSPWASQLTNYKADYYADENGLYTATVTECPTSPTPTSNPTQAPTPPPNTNSGSSTRISTPTKQPTPTQEPSEAIPEFPASIALTALFASALVAAELKRKVTKF
jgi:hypothetical protein